MYDGTDLHFILPDHLGSVSTIMDDIGGVLSQQRYMPFGEVRLDPGVNQTDFGYTGQRTLSGIGLMDYNARWYGQGIGRFTQPDSILPSMSDPQMLNRFSYSNNNPLRFIDPSGHCPRPTQWDGDTTSIICVDLFISVEKILLIGEGDGRGFDNDSDANASRAYLYINLDESGSIVSTSLSVNATVVAGEPFGPVNGYNNFTAAQNINGEITVSWDLWNGLSSEIDAGLDDLRYDPVFEHRWAGGVGRAFASLLGRINGELTLSKGTDGRYQLEELERDPFPSLEVYQYFEDGTDITITQREERYGPILGLSPLSPRDLYIR